MTMKRLIHYGHDAFSLELFDPIENEGMFVKPSGGLWMCPVKSRASWVRWCRDNDHERGEGYFERHFYATLKPDARILTINKCADVEPLPRQTLDGLEVPLHCFAFLDFETLARAYDVIHLTPTGERATRMPGLKNMHNSLYRWDCESVLIMNPDVLIPA